MAATRKIRPELLEYATPILSDRNIEYYISSGKNKDVFITTELSSRNYHLLIEQAMCDKESKEIGLGVPVISLNMIKRGEVPDGPFLILEKDQPFYELEMAM